MTKTVKFTGILFLIIQITSCKQYVQVFNTASNLKVEDRYYVHEDANVRIFYDFWGSRGVMSMSIYNKSDKPIYIDWKKSTYINNSVKINYWEDVEIQNTASYGLARNVNVYYPLLNGSGNVQSSNSMSITKVKKDERITFIPPKTVFTKAPVRIYALRENPMGLDSDFIEVSRFDKPKKKTKVYQQSFDKDSTPLVFRNFLTYSFQEDFEAEVNVDNEFYVSAVLEMNRNNFEDFLYKEGSTKWYVKDEYGNPIMDYKYYEPTRFYIHLVQKTKFNKK